MCIRVEISKPKLQQDILSKHIFYDFQKINLTVNY